MSRQIDEKYAMLVGDQLDHFKQKKPGLYNFRCPFCGDSSISTLKARGYLYVPKKEPNCLKFCCHNGCDGRSMRKFIEGINPQLASEYVRETWESGGDMSWISLAKKVLKIEKPKKEFVPVDDKLWNIDCLADLPDDHVACQFAECRKLPKEAWSLLYYAKDFAEWAHSIDESKDNLAHEHRLVVPIFDVNGTLIAAQGRALTMSGDRDAKKSAKYITIKSDQSIDRLWYGLWRIKDADTVIVFEGPLDSLFLDNAVAMVGLGQGIDTSSIPEILKSKKLIYALDNQPWKMQVCNQMERLIEAGETVCIWPSKLPGKDMNDMVLAGMPSSKVRNIIMQNAFSGLEAKLRFSKWRRDAGDQLERASYRKATR